MNDIEFKTLRILLVTAKPHVAEILRQVLGIVGVTNTVLASGGHAAIDRLTTEIFDAVFCDEAVSRETGQDFGHAARRTKGLLDPMVPVFLVSGGPRRKDVEAARDQGYTDIVARPVSAATVLRKLSVALKRPRPFIVAPEFFGPDRRSQARGAFHGSDRRTRTPKKIRIAKPAEVTEV
ncbi:MAG TPA: response regulator [Rhizomicrobium sp.]|jgi:CheY-like chemotaxis protein